MFHLPLYLSSPFYHVWRGRETGESPGIGKSSSYLRTFPACQFLCRFPEMVVGTRFHAIDAIAHLYRVEIYLHDPLFSPKGFDENREIHLQAFSYPRTSLPEKDVFCRLLRYGAATMTYGTLFPVMLCSLPDSVKIKAVVTEKPLVFACHHCYGHIFGHLVERHPCVMQFYLVFVRKYLLAYTYEHQRREIDGDKTVSHNNKNSGSKKSHHYPSYYLINQSEHGHKKNPYPLPCMKQDSGIRGNMKESIS